MWAGPRAAWGAVLLGWLVVLSQAGALSPDPPAPYLANPAASGYADVEGVKLYFEIHGEGDPVLLLHGGLGGSEQILPSVPTLSERYLVILYDRRGHGRSPDTPGPFTYSEMAREAKGFLDAMQVESAAVVGFSDGGVVGYHLASEFPEKVTRLVALGANYRVQGMGEQAVAWTRDRLTESGVAEDYPEVKQSFDRHSPEGSSFASFLAKTRELWLRDPYIPAEQLRRIGVPVLLMAGDREDITPEHMLEMQRLIAGAQLCIVPNCDHFVIERKTALFNMLVLDFLAGR